MERSFQDLDLTQIKVGAESHFPPEDGEANPNGNGSEPAIPAEPTTTDSEAVATEAEPMAAEMEPQAAAPRATAAPVSAADDTEPEPERDRHHLEEGILKVSSHSRHSAVAGAIAGVLRHENRAEVQAIGAAACYQAIKAVATARSYLLPEGIEISCVPLFTDVTIGEHERTAIRFIVTRHIVEPPQS
jgi:stage V sporulation protein S